MIKKWVLFAIGLLLMGSCPTVYAQGGDAKGCKDHPLVSRMKNYYIDSCEKNFNSFDFFIKDGRK